MRTPERHQRNSNGISPSAFFCLLFCLFYCAPGIQAQSTASEGQSDADFQKWFLSEYPKAWSKLDELYSHVKIVAMEKSLKDGVSSNLVECEYLREGSLVRKIEKVVDVPNANITVRAFGGGTSKFFDMAQYVGNSHFAFLEYGPKSKDDLEMKSRTSCRPLFVCCYGDGQSIKDAIDDPKNHVVFVHRTELDGVHVIEVELDTPGSGVARCQTELYFMPVSLAFAGWSTPALVGNMTMNDPHFVKELRVTYEGPDQNRLDSVRMWSRVTKRPSNKGTESAIVVKSLIFGAIPTEQFSSTALGVAEPVLPTTRSRLGWIFAINVPILIAFGLWLTALARRRQRRNAM